ALSDAELYLFFHLLFSAGAETTRNSIAGGLLELLSRFGSVRVVEPAEWTRSNRHTGIRHLVVELRGG
ncbi:cytochrome P450 126 Cyp126, partial [Mycobacterium tuberculosis variant bovis B2 7505]